MSSCAPTVIFLLSVICIAYVIILYPLLLDWMARRTSNPICNEFKERTVTILLPVCNGEAWLAAKLESIMALDYPARLVDTIVVSDGSTDGTEVIASSFASRARLQVLSLPKGGKAQCLNAGLELATGEILFYTDVRQVLDPACLRHLIARFGDPSVGVVSGELIIREGSSFEEMNVGLYWRYEKWIRRNLSVIDSVPGATGAIYAMRRELARRMPPYTLLDDVYLPTGAFFAGYRVVFEQSAKAYDYPTTLATEFRRKVRTLAGVYQLICVYPALLTLRNRMWVHFISHKLGRLLLPFALLSMLVSSFFLPPAFRIPALAGQAAFYGIAFIDIFIPENLPLKRMSSAARTFVVLMTASLCALSFFFLPAEFFWKPTRPRTAIQ